MGEEGEGEKRAINTTAVGAGKCGGKVVGRGGRGGGGGGGGGVESQRGSDGAGNRQVVKH